MKKELTNTLNALNKGKLILYPTDTVWGIGCDATDVKAVQKIYKLKQRDDSKSMICLVSDYEMLERYITSIPKIIYEILNTSIKPTTIIYNNPKGLAKNAIANDNTLAIRVVKDEFEFCQKLIQQFGKPIISTSANISGEKTPKSYKEISQQILKGVDYIVNLHHEKTNASPSTIIKLNKGGTATIIRQ